MRIVLLSKDSIHLRCRIQFYEATPEGLGVREAISLSSQMAADTSHHEYRFADRRRFFRGNGCFVHIATTVGKGYYSWTLVSFLGGIFAYKRAETLKKIDSLGILLEQKDDGTEIKIKPGSEVRLKLQIVRGTGYN